MADDLPTLSPGDRDPARHNTVTRQAVQRILEVQETANGALQASNNLSDVADVATARANLGAVAKSGDTMTGLLTVQVNTANTDADYLNLKPTDFGSNKPYFFAKKVGGNNDEWGVGLWDGSDTGGTINFFVTNLQHNGNQIWNSSSLPQNDATHAGYLPASGGGTSNFWRADGTFAAPPASGGLTVLSYAGAVGTGTTYTVTGLGGYKMFIINMRDVSHNSGSSQTFRCAVSGDNGSSFGTAISPTNGSAYTAAQGVSGIFFVTNVDQTNNQSVIIGSTFVASLADTSARGPINALQFSFAGGSFDNGSIDIYGLK